MDILEELISRQKAYRADLEQRTAAAVLPSSPEQPPPGSVTQDFGQVESWRFAREYHRQAAGTHRHVPIEFELFLSVKEYREKVYSQLLPGGRIMVTLDPGLSRFWVSVVDQVATA